jgi:indole-3-glycerol phosphate synthase
LEGKLMAKNILETIASFAKTRVEAYKQDVSQSAMTDVARMLAREEKAACGGNFTFPFHQALAAPGLSFICEVKKASPSKGVISEDFPWLEIAQAYDRAGAAAISCLTEPKWFLGSDNYLSTISTQTAVPVLRKDFVVDEYMIFQARVLGAKAVLLIVAILTDAQLERYIEVAHELGLSALVEAHNESEIARAVAAGAKIIGVNNRNLTDFSVDFGNAQRLRAMIPADVLYVAESGVTCADDVAVVAQTGANAVLIGEALMRSGNIADTLGAFKAAANRALKVPAVAAAEPEFAAPQGVEGVTGAPTKGGAA